MIYLYNLSVSNKLLASYTGVKAKKNPEPELFSGGWGVAGVDTYTGLFGEQTNKKNI